MRALGITTRLGDSTVPLLERSLVRRADHWRVVMQPGVPEDALHALVRALPDRVQLLLVVCSPLEHLDDLAGEVERILECLSTRAADFELGLTPKVATIWDPPDLDRLSAVFQQVADLLRKRNRRVVWSLCPPVSEAALDALASRGLVQAEDEILFDVTDASMLDVPRGLPLLHARWNADRVRLAAGGGGMRAPGELEDFAQAIEHGAARLYWQPSAELGRLLARLGPDELVRLLRSPARPSASTSCSADARVLVTGGAGFVGCNLAARLLSDGHEVVVLDNLERDGVERNIEWLRARWGPKLRLLAGDVRDPGTVERALEGVGRVFHLAGQVAVTNSLQDPVKDFEVNARGTLNVLEAIRRRSTPPGVVFTSTNKVYGDLRDVALQELERRYLPADDRLRARGVGESCNLDLHSPYGCSKGAGDQYMLDFAKSYDVPAVVFRMSCIYGPRQLGSEDQGWVAHFFRRALDRSLITIYGDGKQVRDVLFVDDLVDAFVLASAEIDSLRGRAFNIGGGPDSAISLLELVEWIESIQGRRPELSFAPWRRGDQRYYVSDTTRFREATGWKPRVGIEHGLRRLHGWLRELEPSLHDRMVMPEGELEVRTDP